MQPTKPMGARLWRSMLGLGVDDVNGLLATVQAVLPDGVAFDDENIPVILGALPVDDVVSFADEPSPSPTCRRRLTCMPGCPPCAIKGIVAPVWPMPPPPCARYLLGDQSTDANLSEQYIYWACKARDGYPGEGTWIKTAMGVLQESRDVPGVRLALQQGSRRQQRRPGTAPSRCRPTRPPPIALSASPS